MEINIETTKREDIIDITNQVEKIINENANENSKACLVYASHATCAIIVNENYDKAVCKDILSFLKKQIPQGIWEHDAIDNNADSHIKASIIGPGQFIPIKDGELQLGRWQGIALAEFDGPRERSIIITII